MTDTTTDKATIRELVETWAVWRDARLWEQFRTVWHADGRMFTTWTGGIPFEEFIRRNDEGWAKGVRILHFLGGSAIEVAGDRAIAQTKMTISQRASIDGVVGDVVCTGRFYDFFERRSGRWGLVLRQPIYEKDRFDPVDPAAKVALDPDLLKRFPEGYRHLGRAAAEEVQDAHALRPALDVPADELLERDAPGPRGEHPAVVVPDSAELLPQPRVAPDGPGFDQLADGCLVGRRVGHFSVPALCGEPFLDHDRRQGESVWQDFQY